MFQTTPHRQVALAVALVALALTGAVAGVAVGQTDASSDESAVSPAGTDAVSNETGANVTASFVQDGDRLELRLNRIQNVTIRTNANAGMNLMVVLRKNGKYVNQYDATVSENGTATASIDLLTLDLSPESEISLVARYDGRALAETTGVVKGTPVEFVYDGDRPVLENTTNQTVKFRTDIEPGQKVIVQIENESFTRMTPEVVSADGTVTATFDLSDVASGTEINLSLQSSITETEGVILNESATATETTTVASTEATTNGTTQGDSRPDVPGFGVPVALVALLAGLALARRT